MATEKMFRFGVEGARLDPHSVSILGRRDVLFLSPGSAKPGVLLPLREVEFARYRRFYGLGFRATAPQTPRIALRAVFRARQGSGRGPMVGQGTRLRADTDHFAGC